MAQPDLHHHVSSSTHLSAHHTPLAPQKTAMPWKQMSPWAGSLPPQRRELLLLCGQPSRNHQGARAGHATSAASPSPRRRRTATCFNAATTQMERSVPAARAADGAAGLPGSAWKRSHLLRCSCSPLGSRRWNLPPRPSLPHQCRDPTLEVKS